MDHGGRWSPNPSLSPLPAKPCAQSRLPPSREHTFHAACGLAGPRCGGKGGPSQSPSSPSTQVLRMQCLPSHQYYEGWAALLQEGLARYGESCHGCLSTSPSGLVMVSASTSPGGVCSQVTPVPDLSIISCSSFHWFSDSLVPPEPVCLSVSLSPHLWSQLLPPSWFGAALLRGGEKLHGLKEPLLELG